MVESMSINQAALQVFRFGVVGICATLVHMTMALLMNENFGVSPLWANLGAFLTAWPVSYIGNYFWTFGTTTSHGKSFFRFAFAAISGLMLSQIIVWGVADMMGYSLRVALVPALIMVPMFSFTISRFWVFPAQQKCGVS